MPSRWKGWLWLAAALVAATLGAEAGSRPRRRRGCRVPAGSPRIEQDQRRDVANPRRGGMMSGMNLACGRGVGAAMAAPEARESQA